MSITHPEYIYMCVCVSMVGWLLCDELGRN